MIEIDGFSLYLMNDWITQEAVRSHIRIRGDLPLNAFGVVTPEQWRAILTALDELPPYREKLR